MGMAATTKNISAATGALAVVRPVFSNPALKVRSAVCSAAVLEVASMVEMDCLR